MNVYQYIAENNPDAAYEICKKYGYFDVQSIEELGNNLQAIVAEQGEDAFQEVLDIHPEKDVILELFNKKKVEEKPDLEFLVKKIVQQDREMERNRDCSCMKNADGASNVVATAPSPIVNQTNTYILVGALIVSIAILSMKK